MVKQELRQRYQTVPPNAGALWPELFPEPPQRRPASSGRVARRALLSVIAMAAGVVVLLLRIAGPSPLTTIWAEDRTVFLVQALATAGHLFASYAGYLQLLPRLIAQLVSFLPLPEAAAAFALAGAVIASAVALFVFHASAGHIHSVWLRGLLAAAVLLLPVAPLEIADSGVNTPWYLLFALFWAGAVAAARPRRSWPWPRAVGFLAGASTPLALALAPLLILRMAALRRVREHAVTAGLAAGLLLQAPVILAAHNSRVDQTSSPGGVVGFVAHDVVLPALGWHLDWWLQAAAGRNGATLLVGCAPGGGVRRDRGDPARAGPAGGRRRPRVRVPAAPRQRRRCRAGSRSDRIHFHVEPGSRYTTLPIFLMEAAVIVAVDNVVAPGPRAGAAGRAGGGVRGGAVGGLGQGARRHRGGRRPRAGAVLCLGDRLPQRQRPGLAGRRGRRSRPLADRLPARPGRRGHRPDCAVDDPELDRHPVRAPAALTVPTKSKGVLVAAALALAELPTFSVGPGR